MGNCCKPEEHKPWCHCNVIWIVGTDVTYDEDTSTFTVISQHLPEVEAGDGITVDVSQELVETIDGVDYYKTIYTVSNDCCNPDIDICSLINNGEYTTKECQDWVVTIDVDVDRLDLPDEKVAVSSWCTPWFLNDVIEAWYGIHTDVDNCNLVIWLDKEKWVKPYAKIHLWWDQEVTKSHGTVFSTENEWWFTLNTSPSETNDNNPWRSDWITYQTFTWFDGNTVNALRVNKTWRYRVWMNYNGDINFWVHAIRGIVFSSDSSQPVLLDDKPYGVVSEKQINTGADAWEDGATNPDYLAQVSFCRTSIRRLEAGTLVFGWWRIDPYVVVWTGAWQEAYLIMRQSWLASGVLAWWWTLNDPQAWCEVWLEWVSDDNGNMAYED